MKPPVKPPIERRKVYTTGQAARLLNCCPRTVSIWMEKGDLEGYRLPGKGGRGSGDRRILHASLIRFMRETLGMPVPVELRDSSELALVMPQKPPPTTPPEPTILLDSDALARLLSVTVRTIWRLVKKGDLPAPVRLGDKFARWFRADMLAWLEERRRATRSSIVGKGASQ